MIDSDLIPVVARRFRALGEPGRLALLAALQDGERSVSELVELTGRTQPNVSQHLKELAHAGLVEPRRDGARVFYGICDPYLSGICAAICRSVRETHGRVPRGAAVPPRSARRARTARRREPGASRRARET